MGTRALAGFKKDGKYYMTYQRFDGGYHVTGSKILKAYIDNTKDDFEEIFNLIDFKEVPNYDNDREGAIKEALFYRKYSNTTENLITLLNTKDLNLSNEEGNPFLNMLCNDDSVVAYEFNNELNFIDYDKVKDYDLQCIDNENKLSFINRDIFDSNNGAEYIYVYDFDSDSLEFYNIKWFNSYDNKYNRKEILLNEKDIAFRFVNTFTFTRDSRLRKYLEIFESWFYVEDVFNQIHKGEDRDEYIEEVVENNLEIYLKILNDSREEIEILNYESINRMNALFEQNEKRNPLL